MGLGNGNPNSGNKGSNHSFEHRNLLLLGDIFYAITGTGGAPPPAGIATEATLLSILNNMIASQDIEILLVRDTGAADQVVQQIREYDHGTGLWTTRYEDVSGAAYTVVGPLQYIDPSGVLNLILTELQSIDAKVATEATLLVIDTVLDAIKLDTANLDVALSTIASESTLVATNALLTTIDAVLDSIKVDTGAIAVDIAAIEVLITTTNSLLTTIDAVLDAIKIDTGNIATDIAAIEVELLDQGTTLDALETEQLAQGVTLDSLETEQAAQGLTLDAIEADTTTLATPVTGLAVSLIESSTTGTVAAGKRKVSIHNRGTAAADVAGGTNNLAPGLSVTFSAEGLRDTLAEIAYDGTGTTLVISTIG